MKRTLLLLLTVAFGFAAPYAMAKEDSPTEIAGATTVDAAKAKELFDKGVSFIDVRSNKDWEAGRIPGATHIELKKVYNEAELSKVVKKDQEVVMYCNGPKCHRSSKASAKAVGWGFSKVYYFREGLPAWKAAGYPVE
jgi:rhodanese-related sulfurtransferase